MKDFKVALVHCPEAVTYKVVKMTADMSEEDPCIMWVFDSSKFKMALKIMKNMNIADKLNTSDLSFA